MSRLISFISFVAVAASTVPAFAKDTIYREPRRPSFTILVPDGWTVSTTAQGISLKDSEGDDIQLFLQRNAMEPSEYMDNILLPQVRKQTQNFRLIDRGACLFGKQSGAYAVLSGISPNGGNYTTKFVTMTNGQATYLMVEQSDPGQYDRHKAVMQRIQDSFTPESAENASSGAGSPEKAEALHAAGVISDQEYQSAKRGESTFTDPRQPHYSVSVPSGWTALKTNSGVKLEKQPSGDGVAQVWIQPGNAAPSDVIARTAPQLAKQWAQHRVIGEGQTSVGGLKGAYGMYVGIGNSGKPTLIKVLATTDGKWIITMFIFTDLDTYKASKSEFDRIEQSFLLEGAAPAAARLR
jgi:hypothetical protein